MGCRIFLLPLSVEVVVWLLLFPAHIHFGKERKEKRKEGIPPLKIHPRIEIKEGDKIAVRKSPAFLFFSVCFWLSNKLSFYHITGFNIQNKRHINY